MIPTQLKNPTFKFCLLKAKEKTPFEKSWQKKGYVFNNSKLLKHIEGGGNYGVIGGEGNLRVLDIDDPKLAEEFEDKLETFTVKTGGGGKHFYFISLYNKNHVLVEGKGELRANNYQVVGAGCIHPSGNKYEIVKDVEIADVSAELLKALIEPYLRKETTLTSFASETSEKDTSRSGLEYRKCLALIREGKSQEEIFKQMMAYSKWASAPKQYREMTYEKALKYHESLGEEENIKDIVKETYPKIIQVLKEYCDIKEKYYSIIALWIIGTYLHKGFLTYPYLYFNAMKGSGKSRILSLIAYLSKNGKKVVNMSEAVLFRTAENSTICIDEFERVGSKEKQSLRELLNVGYKKGSTVQRAVKKSSKSGDKYEIEEFNVFCPITMCNIWGMDEILGDRSVCIVVEKSTNPKITRKLEIWGLDDLIRQIKESLGVVLCRDEHYFKIYTLWNEKLKIIANTPTPHTIHYTTHTTHPTQLYTLYTNFVNKVLEKTSLDSRDMELFFPLFIIAEQCEVLEETIKIAEEMVKDKKEEEVFESKDVALLDFIAGYEKQTMEYLPVRNLITEFKEFLLEGDKEAKWLNSHWFGVALRRLSLVKKKKRTRSGIDVILNFELAKTKLKVFKSPDEK